MNLGARRVLTVNVTFNSDVRVLGIIENGTLEISFDLDEVALDEAMLARVDNEMSIPITRMLAPTYLLLGLKQLVPKNKLGCASIVGLLWDEVALGDVKT
jgi:hypothetical protein